MSKYFIFTIVRYAEFSLFALMMFLLAKSVPASELGLAAPSFIWMTFSAFVLLGGNQVLVKWYAKESDSEKKSALILYGCGVNFVACAVVYILLSQVVSHVFSASVSVIGAGKVVVECMATINRVANRFQRINLIYLSNILPLCIMFFVFGVKSVGDFFLYWSCSIGFAVLVSLLVTTKFIRSEVKRKIAASLTYIEKNFRAIFLNGVKLAFIGFFSPLVGSLDKLMLSYTAFDKSLLGSMQLADNIASAVALGLGSAVFIVTPKYIKELHENKITIDQINKFGYLFLLFILVFVNVSIFLSKGALLYFFPEYTLFYPLMVQITTKILISGLFMYNMIALAFSDENFYIKALAVVLPAHILLVAIEINILDEQRLFYVVPITGVLTLLVIHMVTYFRSKNIQITPSATV